MNKQAISVHASQIANRMQIAEDGFIQSIQNIVKCTPEQAAKVLRLYRKFKMVKADYVGASINVKHGSFLDKSTIKNAINYAE